MVQDEPEIIRLAVTMYVRFPLSLRNARTCSTSAARLGDLPEDRQVLVARFGPTFSAEMRKRWIEGMRSSRWRWHLDEMSLKKYCEMHYLWRAVDY